MIRILSLMNAYTAGRSGGDVAFLEIFKRISNIDHTIVTSSLGARLCQQSGIKGRFVISTRETSFRNVIWIYLKRLLQSPSLTLRIPTPEYVYASSDILPDVLPAILIKFWAKLRGKRVIYIQKCYHLNSNQRILSSWAQRCSLAILARTADRIITSCQVTANELVRRGVPSHLIAINHLGIDFSGIQNKCRRAPQGAANTVYDAVYLGRIHPSKGVWDLIKIWSFVIQSQPKAKLTIIGYSDPHYRVILEQSIRDSGLESSISYLGELSDAKITEIFLSSKTFVLASHEEGFGIAILEAMAHGLPAVAYDLPVFEELFSEAVTLVPKKDFQAFAHAVVRHIEDANVHSEYRNKSLSLAKKFDWEVAAQGEATLIFNHRNS